MKKFLIVVDMQKDFVDGALGTPGWALDSAVAAALENRGYTAVEKPTFGSTALAGILRQMAGQEDFSMELVGLCTDICVVSNALLLKAHVPEKQIRVDASCCAGVTPKSHEAAVATMASCQIDILN